MVDKKNLKFFAGLFLILIGVNFISAFEFNGTVYDVNGNALNNSVVNITIRDQNFNVVGYNGTTTNASGWFNFSVDDNVDWFYQPVITKTNISSGYVQYVGQSLPAFPSMMLVEIAGTSFYLKEAGTINITAVNSTGDRIAFNYQIKDTKLGYPIAENFDFSNKVSETSIVVPKDRNYSVMIYPDASMPVSFNWNNFSSDSSYDINSLSSYNLTTKTLHKQFNTTMSYVRAYGYILNSSGGTVFDGWDEFTVIPYLLEPGNMVHTTYGTLPYNLSAFFDPSNGDFYNLTTGFYNISLPATVENSEMILFATARNSSSFYGGVRNTSFIYGIGGINIEFNFTIYPLLGVQSNISMETPSGGSINISSAKQSFSFVNSSNDILSEVSGHIEMSVDYSSSAIGAKEFTWVAEISQGESALIEIPLLNITGVKEMNAFIGGGDYAPVRKSYTLSEIQVAQNITVTSFNPGDIDGAVLSGLKISLFKSNSSCDVPNPDLSCVVGDSGLAGEDFGIAGGFNPMKAIIGGGKLSFRMGLFSTGIIVHYVNVDMLASGPPDALFDDSQNSGTTTGSFESAFRFGSGGPTIYDYVLVSMPYIEGSTSVTGLNETSDVNISIPLFYDDNWNVIWNTAVNGTNASALAGNYSHYSARQSEWQILMNPVNCTVDVSMFNSSNPCYINKTENRIWVRLPHFSGTGPKISGAVITATSSDDSSPSSGGGVSSTPVNPKKIHSWTKITPGSATIMKDFDKEMGIKQIQIMVNNEAQNVKITVEKYPDKPAGVSKEKTGKVHKYLQINAQNLEEELDKAIVTIQVEKSWLLNNSVDKDNVAMFKFNETSEEWNELITIYLEEENDYYNYAVELTSFSYFAISEKVIVEAGEEAVGDEKKEIGGEKEIGEIKEKRSLKRLWIGLVVLILIVVGMFFGKDFFEKYKNRFNEKVKVISEKEK